MSEQTPKDDLDLEPVRSGPSIKSIALVVVGLSAAGGAIYVNNANLEKRKIEQLQIASDAWSDLSRCLMGPGEVEIGQIARRARRMELALPSSVARLPLAERRRQWPYRCATYASVMTRALFDSKSAEHRLLNAIVSQAATDLEGGVLHTAKDDRRRYLDELWATVERARLPRGRSPVASIPAPPTPVEPMSAPLLEAVFAGTDNAKPMAQDALAQNTLRVLFGAGERRLCTFENDGGPTGLSRFSCARIRPADFERQRPWLGSAEDGQAPLWGGRINGNDSIARAFLSPAASIANATFGGHVTSQFVTLVGDGEGRPDLHVVVRRRGSETSQAVTDWTELVSPHTISNRRPGGWVFGDVVVLLGERAASSATSSADGGAALPDASRAAGDAGDAGASAGPREGVLYAGALSVDAATLRASWAVPFGERGAAGGPWPSELRVEACRTGNGATAIAAYTNDGHALVLWRTPNGLLNPIRAEARPGSIHCDNEYLRMTWFEPVPIPSVHVATCGQTGCSHARSPSPDIDTDPVVASIGNKILAVYTQRTTNGGYGGLRYRLAPLMDLATAEDHVIFDDGEHEGLQVEATLPVFVRGNRAVVFVTSKGVAGETYAFRINADGSSTPIRAATRP